MIPTLDRRNFTQALFVGAAALAPLAAARAQTGSAAAPSAAAGTGEIPARDREAILGMVGTYKVTFDFRETVSFQPSYKLLEPKKSGGFEVVRVIEDLGRILRLQHVLVVKDKAGKTHTIKHWRQDWEFEPETVLAYERSGLWRVQPVAAAERKGRWSQTVWQVDDSPRYGGIGAWEHDAGIAEWTSNKTLRPLARRDATRHPVYNHYAGLNRHALTPVGWIHEQDNAKRGQANGRLLTYCHETVLNSYVKDSTFEVTRADDYMAATKDYWAAVRQAWTKAISPAGTLSLTEEAEAGSVTGMQLLGWGDDVQSGKLKTDAAIAEAEKLIAVSTKQG